MEFKMTILPRSRRAWLWIGLQIVIFGILFFGASFYVTSMPGRSYSGPLPSLSDSDVEIRERLKGHVSMLAEKIGERNIKHPGSLNSTAKYISAAFESAGFQVTEQEFFVGSTAVKNLEAEITGTQRPDEIVIVGAHYDSVWGSPGANDNASGVAALLELAAGLKAFPQGRTIRFVAFVNEEPPYFQTESMGSRVYARRSHERRENIVDG